METFLVLNGDELAADVDDAERAILQLVSGLLTREALVDWVSIHVKHVG
jgi:prophage maintenance system killer protein